MPRILLSAAAFLMLMAGSSLLAEGTWGGPGIQMTVGPEGAVLELDCAHGAIGGPKKGCPAVYEGRVEGKKLTLVITLAEGKEEVGTWELAQGRRGRIIKCT